MRTPSGASSLSSLLPFLLKKPRWPQHLGQLANQIGYTPIILEISNCPKLLREEKIPEVFEWLLCKGASPTAHRHGYTPLMMLARHICNPPDFCPKIEKNILELTACLFQRGVSLDCKFNPENEEDRAYTGRTALLFACESGNMALLRWLLDHEANPYVQDARGHTAITILSSPDHIQPTLLTWWQQQSSDAIPAPSIQHSLPAFK